MLGYQQNLVAILGEHTKLMVAGAALDLALAQLARGAAELAGCPPYLTLIRVSDPRSLVHMEDVWAISSREPHADAFAETISDAIRTFKPLHAIFAPLRSGETSGSTLIVPLLGNAVCYGYLCLGSEKPNHFTRHLLSKLKPLADQAIQAIHFDAIRSRAALVTTAETAVLSHAQLLLALQKVTDEAVTVLNLKNTLVEILGLTADRDALVTLAVTMASPDGKRSREAGRAVLPGYFAASTTMAWQVITQDTKLEVQSIGSRTDDGKNTANWNTLSTSVAGMRTVVALPLRDERGTILGVMNIEARDPRTLKTASVQLEPLRARAERALGRSDDSVRASATSFRSIMTRIGGQIPSLLDPKRKNLRALYQAILRRAVQMIGVPHLKAAIAFCGEKVFTITSDATYGYPPEMTQVWSWPEDQGLTGKARSDRQTVRIPDVHAPELAGIYFEQDPSAVSEMVVPLLHGDQVVGVFDFVAPEQDVFTARHQEQVEAFARQVVQTLARARDIRSLWLLADDLKLIQDTSEGIERMLRIQTSDEELANYDTSKLRKAREDLLKELLKNATTYTRSDYGAILAAARLPSGLDNQPGEKSVELVEMTSYGLDGVPHITHLPLAKSLSKVAVMAFNKGRPLPYSDVKKEVGEEAILFGPTVQSCLAVPIPGGDRIMGILCLESVDRRMYSPAQINRVVSLASQAANVISAANLYLYRLKMSRLLNLIDDVMTTSLVRMEDVIHPEICDEILRTALNLTEHQDDGKDGYASLWLMRNGKLRFKTSRPMLGDQSNPRPGIVQLAQECEGPIVVPDVAEPPYTKHFRRLFAGTQSELAAPLLDPDKKPGEPGRVLGVLNIESPRKSAFSARDVEIIELLAQIMVTSVRLTEMHNDRIAYLADVSHGLPHLSLEVGSFVRRLRKLDVIPPATDTDSTEIHEIFHHLEQGIETLSTFIECSNTLARHERLNDTITKETTSLLALTSDMISALEFRAIDNEQHIELWRGSQDVTIRCAEDLLKVAIFALIENAIVHGTRGDTISVRVRRLPGYGGRVEVIDHGPPISSEQIVTLFSRRYSRRLPSSGDTVSERGNSSGIGLDHVRRIVHDVHNGRANYRRDRRGKVFYLDLPFDGGETG